MVQVQPTTKNRGCSLVDPAPEVDWHNISVGSTKHLKSTVTEPINIHILNKCIHNHSILLYLSIEPFVCLLRHTFYKHHMGFDHLFFFFFFTNGLVFFFPPSHEYTLKPSFVECLEAKSSFVLLFLSPCLV